MTQNRATTSQLSDAAKAVWSPADLDSNPHEAPDKALRVRKMFAAIARRYDLNNRVHSFGRDQAWRRKAVALCGIRPTDDVLDVACGTGDLTEAFAAAAPRSVTGLDFTEEMLQIAREKSARRALQRTTPSPSKGEGWGEGAAHGKRSVPVPTYIQGDAMNLPFADASFDVVSIAFGIRNVSDTAKALREFRRVLRSGGEGRLVVLEFSQPRNRIIRWFNNFYCGKIMPITATLIARDRSGAYRYLPKSVATFSDRQQFAELLAACGYSQITIHPMTLGVCTAYLAHT